MAWLGSRLVKRPPADGQETEPEPELTAEEEQEDAPPAPAGPPLVLLVPDVAGVSSFRLHLFYSAESAATFIASSLPFGAVPGIHAFWALHQPPAEPADKSRPGEAMVLIRWAEQSDAVYMVSFVDIDSALSFVRFEVKRGLNLGLVMIYWADLVQVSSDDSGVRITPESPPQGARHLEPDLPRAELQAAGETDSPQPQALMMPPLNTPRSDLVAEAEEALAIELRNEAQAAGMLIDEAPTLGAEHAAAPAAKPLYAEPETQEPAAAAEQTDIAEIFDVGEPAPGAQSPALQVLDQPDAPAEPALETPRSELQAEANETLAIERRNEAEAAGTLIDEAPPVGAEQTAAPAAHLLDAELAAQQQAAAAEAADVPDVVDAAEPALGAESAALEAPDQPEAPAEPALEIEPPSLDVDGGGELPASDLEIAAAEDLFQPEQARSDEPTDSSSPEAEQYAGELLDAVEGSGGMIAEPEMETPIQDPLVEEPVVEPSPQDEPAPDSTEPEGEPPDGTQATEVAEASPAEAAEPQPQPAPDDDLEQEDVVSEVENILRIKRWEKRNKPFRGFGSPPGRF